MGLIAVVELTLLISTNTDGRKLVCKFFFAICLILAIVDLFFSIE
jgi:hypothetical protein